MKAVIYTRQSSGDDDYSESVEVQKANCIKLAKANGLDILGEFSDLNASGKLYPAGYDDLAGKDVCYQNWLKDVSSRKTCRIGLGEVFKLLSDIDYIIVDDYTRLARPLSGSFLDSLISQNLIAYKVKVLTVKSGVVDLNAFNDSLITALQNRINDHQLSILRKKTIDGLKRLKDTGVNKQGISRILGFKSTGRKHEIESIPREIEAVKFIYNQYLEGMGINEIARNLNVSFSDIFKEYKADRQIVRKTLLRPFYCGYIYDSNNNLIKSLQVGDKAFISFEDWMKVNHSFELRKVTKKRSRHNWNPLSGHVFCGVCGSKMIMRGGNTRNPFYSCLQHFKIHAKPCKNNLTISIQHEYGQGLIEAISPLLVLGVDKKIKDSYSKNTFKTDLNILTVELTNTLKKEKNASKLYLEGLLDESTFQGMLRHLKKIKEELNIKILQLKEQISGEDDIEKLYSLRRRVSRNDISHREFEELFVQTVKKITVEVDSVHIETIAGNLTLPRQRISGHNLLPYFSFTSLDKTRVKVYYYYGKKREIANVYAKNQVLTTLGNLEVVYLK